MAELALTRAKRPQLKALAQKIKASQTAENAQMRRWYREWYVPGVNYVGGRVPNCRQTVQGSALSRHIGLYLL
jgi:hypothetical protein